MAFPWLIARQVREAIRNDRPDEARRLLAPLMAQGHRRSWRLAREVAASHVRRAERFLRQDNADAAWGELLTAEGLNSGEGSAATLRQTLEKYGLAVVRAALEAGKPLAAVENAERLRERGVRHAELTPLLEAAQDWCLASEVADRGDFLLAGINLDHVRPRLSCPPTGLDRFAAELRGRHERFRHALSGLHAAVEAQHWREAIPQADEALAEAPAHRQARVLRRKAWERLHPETHLHTPEAVPSLAEDAVSPEHYAGSFAPEPAMASLASIGTPADVSRASSRAAVLTSFPDDEPPLRRLPGAASDSLPTATAATSVGRSVTGALPKRFLLWVNNAGGYLVCLSPRVTFGQGLTDGPVDVPLLADVSRLHAELTRDAEGYVLETQREVTVNGQPVTRIALKPGDRVTLGPSCQFLFHLPSPMSPSARLEFVSGHHFPLAVCSVLLMAENLILGPDETSHVCLPGLKAPVVLFRGRDGLGVTAPGSFRVENQPCRDRAALSIPGWVHGPDFGFGLEPMGVR